jgi:hypothetical protein
MNSHIELVVFVDDDLRVAKVQWQWRGHAHKNGSSPSLLKAYEDACDAYMKEVQ